MGACIVAADVGSSDKCTADGAPTLPRHHPMYKEQQPTGTNDKSKPSRPDFFLQVPRSANKPAHNHIVELKVCRDTTPQDQLNRAEAQHARLQGGLGAKLTTILIGASGTIYKGHTIQALEQLGVSIGDAKKCATKLHLAAVRSLYEIIRLRRRLENGMTIGSGRSGNQPPSRTKRPP